MFQQVGQGFVRLGADDARQADGEGGHAAHANADRVLPIVVDGLAHPSTLQDFLRFSQRQADAVDNSQEDFLLVKIAAVHEVALVQGRIQRLALVKPLAPLGQLLGQARVEGHGPPLVKG